MTRKEIYDIITDENKTDEEKLDILESEEEELLLDAVYSLFDTTPGPVVDYHCIGDYENALSSLTDWCMEDGTDEETAEKEAKDMLKDVEDIEVGWLVPMAGGAKAYGSIYEALTDDYITFGYDAVEMVLDTIETEIS